MSGEVNVVALVRGEEQYVFVFDESSRTDLLRLLGRYAADPELSFNWFDAAVLSQRIREMMPANAIGHANSSSEDSGSSGSTGYVPSRPSSGFTRTPRFHIS